jgi:glycosyltransferase involved in cell wall biosynthesis
MGDLGSTNLEELLLQVGPTLVVKELQTINTANTANTATTKNTNTKPFLCLNMIVKNESKIILRLLTSVLPLIDSLCICDTGSTDNTVELIEAFQKEHGIPGVVVREPFLNFGYNRTFALKAAEPWGVYALLLDADMKLVIRPEFDKRALTADGYSIQQKNGGLDYYNIRIVRLGKGVRCISPTHEYYDFPPGCRTEQLKTLSIDDIGDGGAKADKFERDIRLLKQGLVEEPRNERYHFYIANSYRDAGKTMEAIEYYKKRVELGGWTEEVFYAAFECGNMYARLGDAPSAVHWWLLAYQRHPARAESLYECVKHYRVKGEQHVAQLFLDTALSIPYPSQDVLFIKSAVYEYLLEYERSILAYYTKRPYNHRALFRLLEQEELRHNVLENYKFYAVALAKRPDARKWSFNGTAEKSVGGRTDTFTSSSPCLFVDERGGYSINIRYVNYRIRGDGGYDFRHTDGKITTLQLFHRLSKTFEIEASQWISEVAHAERRYQGVEDCKIVADKGTLRFLGTVENEHGKITMGSGVYDPLGSRLVPVALKSPMGRDCEKNWCYFHDASNALRLVYDWSPLRIGTVSGDVLTLDSEDSSVPAFFRHVRGSTNGCVVGDEVWFLCHVVHYVTPRHYYHLVVVLDRATLKYKKHSTFFKFEGDCIEYALGLIVEESRVLISYSQMDRTSAILEVPRTAIVFDCV